MGTARREEQCHPAWSHSYAAFGAFYESKEFEEKRKALIPTRRIGEPYDVAQAALFLASDRGSYVNGAEILIDGGLNTMLMEMVPRPGY